MILLSSHLTSESNGKALKSSLALIADVLHNTSLFDGVEYPIIFLSGNRVNSYRAPYQFIVGHHNKLLSGTTLNYCLGQ
nr:hypothetical protein [uncultured Carboxylicivirga sp.]